MAGENDWTQNVYSSHIQSIAWSEDPPGMQVTWDGGKISLYSGVSSQLAHEIANAPSVGSAIHEQIKGRYDHQYLRG